MCRILTFLLTALLMCGTCAIATAATSHCTIAPIVITFEPYTPAAVRGSNTSALLRIQCAAATTAAVALSPGSSGSSRARVMIDEQGNRLRYNLYRDSQMTMIWGDGLDGSSALSQTFSPQNSTLLLFGNIPGGQMVHAGTYHDTITLVTSF